MRIHEIMTQPPVTCRDSDTVARAAELMWQNDCGTIPVVNEENRPIGMITDRDCCMSAYTQGRALHEIPVTSAMSKQVFSCTSDDSVDQAEKLMSDKKVRRLPVVNDGGQIVGVVSVNDLARYASGNKKSSTEHEVLMTFAQIGQPPSGSGRPSVSKVAQVFASAVR
jgi:CBS domain-containing protein